MAKKITNPINNAHDLFFKATMSSPQPIRDFFKAYLPKYVPEYINLSSIKPAKAEHVSAALKKSLNDLVFTCQIDGNPGFLLVEHQSSPDWRMHLRFLKYNIELLEHYLKGKKPGTPLPYMYNICIVHDKLNKPYPYPINFYDYFPNPELARNLAPFVKFDLYNLSCCSDEELESHGTISLMEKLFKYQGINCFLRYLARN
jgi:predicted transposase/invertase (TIGR01784 family)